MNSRSSRDPKRIFLNIVAGMMLIAALIVVGDPGRGALTPAVEASRPSLPVSSAKISSELRAQLGTNSAAKIAYAVVLSQQADVTNNIRDWNAKGRYVLDTLQRTANTTQPPVIAILDQQKVAGNVEAYKSYYIVNALSVTGNLASAEAVAALPEIARVDVWHEAMIDVEPEVVAAPEQPLQDIGWHVYFVRAPQAWVLGYDGTGITIGSMMTGVRYTHRTLVHSYRGFLGAGVFDHNYNWWDTTHWRRPVPYEDTFDTSPGTMHIGVLTGDDGHFQPGIAPGAKWIDVKWVDANGMGNEARGLEAMQFMLAPWDQNWQNPDPDKRPAVVSNPWQWSFYTHNCSTQTIFRQAIQAWVAAGIFPSFPGGDSGEYGNRVPAAYPETFETGATFSTGERMPASAMGPSCFDGGQLPQVMAGSSAIWAPYRNFDSAFAYLGISGTEAIAAGAVAIVKQANPELTIAETWYVLTSTAYMDPAWGPRPNNEYGWGVLRTDYAAQLALQMRGTPTPTATGTPPTGTPTRTPSATRTSTPSTCGVTTLLREDFESGTLGVFTTTMGICDPGGCRWEVDDVSFYSGGYSGFAPNYSGTSDSILTTISPVTIPASAAQAELSFWTRHEFEGSAGVWYGAGVMEFSTDGGSNWVDAEPLITMGGYGGTVDTHPISDCALAGRRAWVGSNSSLGHYFEVRVNMISLVGQSVMFRFRLGGCDFSPGSGWWIDDLALTIVEPCVTGTPPTVTYTPTPTPYLHDQYNNAAESHTLSATFINIPDWTSQAADDFTVPTGQAWSIERVDVDGHGSTPVQSFGVYIYADQGGLPGQAVYSQTASIPSPGPYQGDYQIPLNPAATLVAGAYWISVQENDSGPSWWEWMDRWATNANGAAWRNPDEGMREGCPTWGRRANCWGGASAPDQVFRLAGTFQVLPLPSVTVSITAAPTASLTPTSPPGSTATKMATVAPSATSGVTSPTVQSTSTSTPVSSTATPGPCLIEFLDVLPGSAFYSFIRCLACLDIVSGYSDGTFRPSNNITRGQLAKIVSNAAGFLEPITGQSFEDVPTGSPFHEFMERLYRRGHMSGYACGQRPSEACVPPDNRPYFRPGENASRGQISKITANAAGYIEPATGQFYADVDEGNPFYSEIMRLTVRGVMSGYACGGEGEPCDSQNRPYFRWGHNVTRGQGSKIVANTFYPGCSIP